MYPAGITIIAAVKYPVKRKGNVIRSREGRRTISCRRNRIKIQINNPFTSRNSNGSDGL